VALLRATDRFPEAHHRALVHRLGLAGGVHALAEDAERPVGLVRFERDLTRFRLHGLTTAQHALLLADRLLEVLFTCELLRLTRVDRLLKWRQARTERRDFAVELRGFALRDVHQDR